jgi:hypothetical protein
VRKIQNPVRVRSFVPSLVLSSVLLCGAVHGAGLSWPWPMMRGTLSGSTRLDASGPTLAWRVVAQPAGEGELAFEISANGSGGHLQAHARIMTGTGNGEWQVDACRLDLAPWLALLAAKFPALSGWQGSGVLTVAGHGMLRGGIIDGTATLALADGELRNDKKKIFCEGMTLQLVLAGLQSLRAEPGQELTLQTVTAAGAELHDLKVSFELAPGGEVRVAEAGAAGFGGKLSAEPFAFTPAQMAAAFIVHGTDLDLAQVRAFADPQQIRMHEASGRMSGQLMLRLDPDGLRLGCGTLALNGGELARVLFQPTPGLFTSYLPVNVRGIYTGFEPIELGKLPMLVKKLQVDFYPEGETAERTVHVQLEGDSTDAKRPAPIVLDINVDGPLQQAIQRYLSMQRGR